MSNEYNSRSINSVIDTLVSESVPLFTPLKTRLIARLFATSLDQKLAAGQNPASSPLLSARSQQLVAARYRRSIADSWLDLLIEVRRPYLALNPSVPLGRSSVLEAEDEIHALAEALASPLPSVRGVAMSVALLRDGAGPLFNRGSDLRLTNAINGIITVLNPLTTASTL